MDKRLMRYQFVTDHVPVDDTATFPNYLDYKVAAVVEDTADDAIVAAVIAAAQAEEITDLYLLDKTFILDAIREKKERENPKPLTLEELLNASAPVWIMDRLGVGFWAVVIEHTAAWVYFVVFGNKTDRFRRASYGTDWIAYRHRPEED